MGICPSNKKKKLGKSEIDMISKIKKKQILGIRNQSKSLKKFQNEKNNCEGIYIEDDINKGKNSKSNDPLKITTKITLNNSPSPRKIVKFPSIVEPKISPLGLPHNHNEIEEVEEVKLTEDIISDRPKQLPTEEMDSSLWSYKGENHFEMAINESLDFEKSSFYPKENIQFIEKYEENLEEGESESFHSISEVPSETEKPPFSKKYNLFFEISLDKEEEFIEKAYFYKND